MRTVNITCENTHQEYEIELGTTLRDVKKIIFPENHNHILGALVNNQLQDLCGSTSSMSRPWTDTAFIRVR